MKEIESLSELDEYLQHHHSLEGVVFQDLDLTEYDGALGAFSLEGAVLLGCTLQPKLLAHALGSGALVFPRITGLPFDPYRNRLYSVEDLCAGFDPARPDSYAECYDARVYAHWQATGRAHPASILETLARRLHDHAMTDALEELLEPEGADPHAVVAVMGGHSMPRGDEAYLAAARIARALSREGFLLATGGGPGVMEAAHVGAYFAPHPDDALKTAVAELARAPRYDDPSWLVCAFEVRRRFVPEAQDRHPSLGIPTWFYGHEPPNAFASHIAKYFANSVREDGLLTIAKHGIVFTPGSAGTIQEIFQDACQNHYAEPNEVSPMIFFGRAYWTIEKPVYPLLAQLAQGRAYADWLFATDDPDEVVDILLRFRRQQSH